MELNLSFDFKARYFKSAEINRETTQVWYVLHGYGQLAEYFIRKFEVLAKQNICVIAPEGVSRFYLQDLETRIQGGSDRVGATWMTRENRVMDIENYVAMLDAIHQKETTALDLPITILGFSQGAATATRWALQGQINFSQLILWAGIFPPDMNFELGHQKLRSKKVITVFGKDDPFLTEERMKEMEMLSEKLGIKPQTIAFEGKHDIDEEVLLRLI